MGGGQRFPRTRKPTTMALNLEDSLSSTLEYDAEVAYISATSPVAAQEQQKPKIHREAEFDFTLESNTDTSTAPKTPRAITAILEEDEEDTDGAQRPQTPVTPAKIPETNESPKKEEEKVDLILMSDPKHKKENISPKSSNLTPLLPPPHYILDVDSTLPGTPTSKLRLIKEAQASPPSPKLASPKFKFAGTHNYKILVIYGSSGCGRTHLVQKLVHSNPAVFAMVVSTTTRRQRANEVDGVDFHFISHKDIATGLARGDFIEYVQVKRQKRDDKRRQSLMTATEALGEGSKGTPPLSHAHQMLSKKKAMTMTQVPTDQSLVAGHRFESLFDLTEEDSPVLGGEVFGTTHQSLTQAIQQGKSCVVINVSARGAVQLKNAGIDGAYVCIHTKKLPNSQEITPNYTICADNMEQAYAELKQYAFQLIQDLNLAQSTKYEIAKHEWDSLPTIVFENKQSAPQKKVRPVTFSEILTHFQNNADIKKKIAEAKTEQPKRGLSHLFSRSGTKLAKKLQHEKLMVLAIARCSLNDKERLHLRTLQTIYSKLTGSSLNCRRFGNHWKDIGFNGIDPADDLQGVGFLGLVQLVYFLDNPRTMPIAQEIFRHCREESHQIPFCVLSINFTQIALAALRDGNLNKLCNKRDQVFVVVNEFYMAMFNRYFKQWKTQHKTILELGPLIQEIGEHAKANLKDVIQEFEQLMTRIESSSAPEPESLQTAENPFTPLDKITDV